MDKIKLSIITINYNNCHGLKRTIKSVVEQTYRDFEWIVIDGGSSDGSKDLLEVNSDYFSYWCSEPDKGIYNAMNKGIRHSNGEYLLFLNSGDSLLNNNTLEKVAPFLESSDLCIADICYLDDPLHIPRFNIPTSASERDLIFQLVCFTFPHPSSFIKRRLFEVYGMYDENFKIVSDWTFFFKSVILGNATIKILPFVVSVFDTTGISSTSNQNDEERKSFLKQRPGLYHLCEFYTKNYEIVNALETSWYGRLLTRIAFFIYRKSRK